jgi:predicted ATP-dependent protease
MKKPKSLNAESLYHACDLSLYDFQTTADLEPLDQPLGQERALGAIEFGVDIQRPGFNLFVHGAPGLGKHELVQQVLAKRTNAEQSLYDWCYVNNFENPQMPKVLKLPAGLGRQLRKDMESFVEDILMSLPSSFQSEENNNRRQEIEDDLNTRQEQTFRKLSRKAEERGIAIIHTPRGFTLGPLVDGKLLDPKKYEELPQDEKDRIEKMIAEIQLELQAVIREMPLLQREYHQRIKALNEDITQNTVEQLIAWMEKNYKQYDDVMSYLTAVKRSAIENAAAFLPPSESGEFEYSASRVRQFHEYRINVIVDNHEAKKVPVIFEDNPTYQNLIGRVEYVSQMGTLKTDFTLIKPGALHRANGGFLIIDARKLLTHPYAWEGLKRVLKAGEIKIQSLEQVLSLANNVSLEPEYISFNAKVILSGEPIIYYLLNEYDNEFAQLFKVAADFSADTDRSTRNLQLYARLVAAIQCHNDARPLDRESVGKVIEQASRDAEDGEKLSLQIDKLRDLLSEADYWAAKAGRELICLQDINQTIAKRRFRQNKYSELSQQQINRGIKLIDTDGKKVGQVNALSVLRVGDYRFGLPSRITATARLGRGSVIDIERESKLGGDIHSKAVMILSAYLANRYAASSPLPLAATLAFEQSYGRVDGDSATAAELCVLLSALGDIGLMQSIAVTGSMNQHGDIQAVGGVNEKIEGFFEVCKARGLSASQGVIIPESNRVHLMLPEQIRQAVAAGKFNIYCAGHVEDAMEIMSSLPRGKLNRDGYFSKSSFNGRIQRRIEALQQLRKKFKEPNKSVTA